eukprot:TRINITY_DN844_c1_g1_i10.p3 TRINITY_DN844_c1_g1~~TRINITY_DN844_c1_g1_i10.p3  ORF type:complete len:291 (+),score=-24.51 TRINITY_DN844_c1_g1_i10:855-1727(+)
MLQNSFARDSQRNIAYTSLINYQYFILTISLLLIIIYFLTWYCSLQKKGTLNKALNGNFYHNYNYNYNDKKNKTCQQTTINTSKFTPSKNYMQTNKKSSWIQLIFANSTKKFLQKQWLPYLHKLTVQKIQKQTYFFLHKPKNKRISCNLKTKKKNNKGKKHTILIHLTINKNFVKSIRTILQKTRCDSQLQNYTYILNFLSLLQLQLFLQRQQQQQCLNIQFYYIYLFLLTNTMLIYILKINKKLNNGNNQLVIYTKITLPLLIQIFFLTFTIALAYLTQAEKVYYRNRM